MRDPATAATPRAGTPADVVRLASLATSVREVDALSSVCRACPRLVTWREQVAATRRRAFADQEYWGRPVTGFGDTRPWLLVLGLAPAAHGGNRTGRVFTGDRSGDWLFAALHRAGLATQAQSVHADDGQRLLGTRIVPAVRCAPPANRPTPAERDACAGWLDREVLLLAGAGRLRVVLALGAFAWEAALGCTARLGWPVPRPQPRFAHGAQVVLGPAPDAAAPPGARTGLRQRLTLIASYHVSQQNTFTGRLTAAMLDDVLRQVWASR